MYDAIVIGSGIGGLTAAGLLARVAGKKVLVLERHSEPGGLTHVFRRDGASWDVGLHYVGQMQPGSPTRAFLDFLSDGRLRWNAMPDEFERFHYPGLDFAVPSDPARYARCFADGYYLTGDLARRDAEGYYWFVGRADDVIKSSGHLIGPFEVESALLEHPAVAESAVVGKPDPDRGEIVKAFVVLRAGRTADPALIRELQDHCKTVTAPYKYPREIEFVAELPKTRSGKIRRVELRNLERERTHR